MKILVYGPTPERGYPLGRVLRDYGRHSVVTFGAPLWTSLGSETPLPNAPQLDWAIREGSDLAVVATRERHVLSALRSLAHGWLTHRTVHTQPGEDPARLLLPVVVVTPTSDDILRLAARLNVALSIAYAPFQFRGNAAARLLTLPRIRLRLCTEDRRVHTAVSCAWAPVDNKIPVLWE